MLKEKKIRMLRSCLGKEKLTKGDELVYFCPKKSCEEYIAKDKAKLSVNLKSDIFHCWVCGYGGKNLVAIFRMRRDLPEFQEYMDEIQHRNHVPVEFSKTYAKPTLPEEFKTLSEPSSSPVYRAAMRYLTQRGITSDDVLRYKLGYCEDGPYRYRIIVPSFDEYGELNFVVGRMFYENGGVKYKHDELDKDIIFNDYLVDWSSSVTLVEGPFDMIKAGENVIPLQSCHIREDSKLFTKIVTRGVPVYFGLDADAFKKSLKIIGKFLAYGIECHYIPLNGKKDPGEMKREEFLACKEKSILVQSTLDTLKIRVRA